MISKKNSVEHMTWTRNNLTLETFDKKGYIFQSPKTKWLIQWIKVYDGPCKYF